MPHNPQAPAPTFLGDSVSTQFADIKSMILAYSGLLSHQDTLTLACASPGGSSSAFCNFQWLEVW